MSMKFHQGDPINRELFVSVYHKVCHMTQITGPLVGGKVVASQRYSTNDWPNIYEKGDAKNTSMARYTCARACRLAYFFVERSRGSRDPAVHDPRTRASRPLSVSWPANGIKIACRGCRNSKKRQIIAAAKPEYSKFATSFGCRVVKFNLII